MTAIRRSAGSLPRIGQPIATLLFLVVGAPLLAAVVFQLGSSVGFFSLTDDGPTVRYWLALISDRSLGRSLAYTVAFATAATLLYVGAALAMILFHPNYRLNRTTFAALAAATMMPPLAVTIGCSWWLSDRGLLRTILDVLGRDSASPMLLTHDPLSLGVLLAQGYVAVPLLTLSFAHAASTVQLDPLARTARALGASTPTIVRDLAAPLIVGRSGPVIALVFLATMGLYEAPLILGQQSVKFLAVFLTDRFTKFDLDEKPVALAMGSLYTILIWVAVLGPRVRKTRVVHEIPGSQP